MYKRVCAYSCICVGGVRGHFPTPCLRHSPPWFWRPGLSLGPRPQGLDWSDSSVIPKDLPVSTSSVLESQVHTTYPWALETELRLL